MRRFMDGRKKTTPLMKPNTLLRVLSARREEGQEAPAARPRSRPSDAFAETREHARTELPRSSRDRRGWQLRVVVELRWA